MMPSDWAISGIVVCAYVALIAMVTATNGWPSGLAVAALPVVCVVIAFGLEWLDRRFG